MKFISSDGTGIEGYKLPLYRSVHCPAYESDGKCEYYGYSFIEGGCWEGSICYHPKAKGNKNGWLITCPH